MFTCVSFPSAVFTSANPPPCVYIMASCTVSVIVSSVPKLLDSCIVLNIYSLYFSTYLSKGVFSIYAAALRVSIWVLLQQIHDSKTEKHRQWLQWWCNRLAIFTVFNIFSFSSLICSSASGIIFNLYSVLFVSWSLLFDMKWRLVSHVSFYG